MSKKATWPVMIMVRFIIVRFEGDKLVKDRVEYDRYYLFRQLPAVWAVRKARCQT